MHEKKTINILGIILLIVIEVLDYLPFPVQDANSLAGIGIKRESKFYNYG